MKILDLVQGSQKWINARFEYITATDMATILDISPWDTPYKLFFRKLNKKEQHFSAQAKERMEKGHVFEKEMREHFEKTYSPITTPCVSNDKFPYLMASLDGLYKNTLYEFKYSQKAVSEVPHYHEPQVQTQLLLSGAELCYYVRGTSVENYQVFTVHPDPAQQEDIVLAARKFYERLKEANPPQLSENDTLFVNDPRMETISRNKLMIEKLQLEVDECKLGVVLQYPDSLSITDGNISITRSIRKGLIQYSKIPEIKGMDLEAYRGSPSEVITVRSVK